MVVLEDSSDDESIVIDHSENRDGNRRSPRRRLKHPSYREEDEEEELKDSEYEEDEEECEKALADSCPSKRPRTTAAGGAAADAATVNHTDQLHQSQSAQIQQQDGEKKSVSNNNNKKRKTACAATSNKKNSDTNSKSNGKQTSLDAFFKLSNNGKKTAPLVAAPSASSGVQKKKTAPASSSSASTSLQNSNKKKTGLSVAAVASSSNKSKLEKEKHEESSGDENDLEMEVNDDDSDKKPAAKKKKTVSRNKKLTHNNAKKSRQIADAMDSSAECEFDKEDDEEEEESTETDSKMEDDEEEEDDDDECDAAPAKPAAKTQKIAANKDRSTPDAAAKTYDVRKILKAPFTQGDDLPVITLPQHMFDDMIGNKLTDQGKNAEILLPLLKRLKNRTLRVATMCSGTESPILALDMIQNAIRDVCSEHLADQLAELGITDCETVLQIEHVFSCEIEPFKQAYIERNFAPPLLFRDIRELGRDQAYTAYGGLVDVPCKGIDLLIAGTSCVDYSNLNNKQKKLEDQGESGQTFGGMLEWIKKSKTPLVILENVSGAPWEKKVALFEELGYAATFLRFDTKKYYVPHTRQRGYLFAVMKSPTATSSSKSKKLLDPRPGQWQKLVKSLERPASAALDAFMLPNDDPRVLRGRKRLTAESSANGAGRGDRAGRTDWTKCETRHNYARSTEELGDLRPLTDWTDSSSTKMPSFAWNEWMDSQVHRIHDLTDINTLRLAQVGIDSTYKTMVFNLSQNVDRDTMGKLGLSQCLTPTGVPYVTNRGGPLVGEELLLLQGIPADDLLLTKESEDNLKDLAGNAMSTTVVGAAVLCALLQGHEALEPRSRDDNAIGAIVPSLVPRALTRPSRVTLTRNMGTYETQQVELRSRPLQGPEAWAELLRAASLSSRMCVSEGPEETIPIESVVICQDCGKTSSKQNAYPPRRYEPHNWVEIANQSQRVQPSAFRTKLLHTLPMQIVIQNLNLDQIARPVAVDQGIWDSWTASVNSAVGTNCHNRLVVFRFTKLTRSHVWTAHFVSASTDAHLECQISGAGVTWFLFATAPSEPGPLRNALQMPVARLKVVPPMQNTSHVSSLLGGDWELCLPQSIPVEVCFQAQGKAVPSWRNWLGLKGQFQSEYQFETLKVSIETSDDDLKSRINGCYTMLPNCGGACGSLRKKVFAESNSSDGDVFLFLESGRKTLPEEDAFVFSSTCHRTSFGEYRETDLQLDPKAGYRAVHLGDEVGADTYKEVVKGMVPGLWVRAHGATMAPSCDDGELVTTTTVSLPKPGTSLNVALSPGAWETAPELVSCTLPLACNEGLFKKCQASATGVLEVNLNKSKHVLEDIAFVTSRLSLPVFKDNQWLSIDRSRLEQSNGEDKVCEVCSPSTPKVKWTTVKNGKMTSMVPIEDGKDAAVFERALKERPHVWVVRLISPSPLEMRLSIGCNPASLVQRAFGRFPAGSFSRKAMIEVAGDASGRGISSSSVCYEWRVCPHVEKSVGEFPKLKFTSNRHDAGAQQPPNFKKFELRPEQLRSLAWMLRQESSVEPFLEEEVTESVLPSLSWRAEGRAIRPVLVPGGIIADEVGYGKTAITLGLIDAAPFVNGPPEPPRDCISDGYLFTKATLVIVPGHLLGQWTDEINKFLSGKKKVVVLRDLVSLNKIDVKEISNADIVVASFSLLSNDKYFTRMARLSGVNPGSLPAGRMGGRHFDAVYGECLSFLRPRVVEIVNSCGTAFSSIVADADKANEDAASEDAVQLDGKKAAYKNGSPSRKKPKKATSTKPKLDSKERDPWELSTNRVKSNHIRMKCPTLEMFKWSRIVVDEFTYLRDKKNSRVQSMVLGGLKANARWFLSGTPSHANFNDISSLAALLGVHLGVPEPLPLTKSAPARKEATGLENLSQYLEVKSIQWHERRHCLAQNFLDRFVRQNIAECDEIITEFFEVCVDLAPAERAIYLEMETMLKSLEMNKNQALKSKKKSTGDRDSRMQKVLRESESGEEALLKHACHYDFDVNDSSVSAHQSVAIILELRKSQLLSLEKEMVECVEEAFRQRSSILAAQPGWRNMRRSVKGEVTDSLSIYLGEVEEQKSVTHGADDAVHCQVQRIVKDAEEAFKSAPKALYPISTDANENQPDDAEGSSIDGQKDKKRKRSPAKASRGTKAKSDEVLTDELLYDMKISLRNHMHKVRSLGKELCGRVRSLRYIERVQDFQSRQTVDSNKFQCNSCKADGLSIDRVGVLSCCGHTGCTECLRRFATDGVCLEPTCSARVSLPQVIAASELGLHQEEHSSKYGTKLTAIVEKVKEITESDDRVIVFCQFDDLMQKTLEALKDGGISTKTLQGSVQQQIAAVSVFQKETVSASDPRVLLLKMDDEQSAGLNLTSLNHAVFVHPLFAASQQEYDAYETQAIGRIRRYGQKKKVHVWRYFARGTIDMEIRAERLQGTQSAASGK